MADRRTEIITATNELFRAQGYHGTSLSQISEVSGATTGSIYHCFPGGKDELTAAVIETTAGVYRELFEAIAGAATDPVAAYADFFEGAAAVLAESGYLDPCPIGTIAREIASTNEHLRRSAAAAFESWVSAASDHLTSAGIDAAAARDLALVFVAAVEGGFVLCRTLRDPAPMMAASRVLVSQVAAAIELAGVTNR
jgi:AcrR family transcriptional regulator